MFIYSSLKSKAQGFLKKYKEKDTATYAAAEQAIGGLLILDGFIGIDNPLGGKKRPGIFGTVIGFAIGIMFIFMPAIFGQISGTSKMTSTTTAKVVSVGSPQVSTTSNSNGSTSTATSCSLTATYTVNGQSYTEISSSGSSSNCSQAAGNTISINYNPNSPSSWTGTSDAKSMKQASTIFMFAGILVAIVSFFTFLIRLFSIIFGWKLLKNGRALAATLPKGTSLDTVIEQIKKEFKTSLFNFSSASKIEDAVISKLSK